MIGCAATLADIKILRAATLQASGQKMNSMSVILIMTLLYFVSFIKVLYLHYSNRLSASIKQKVLLLLTKEKKPSLLNLKIRKDAEVIILAP